MIRTLAHDDVVFVCPSSDPLSYAKYGATVIASGGAHASDYVNKLRRQGIHTTGTALFLTAASSHDALAYSGLSEATARDIEGKPIAVPWLKPSSSHDAPVYFGCQNHPAFRAHVRRKVCDAMSGGPDGLHVDEHLGSAAAALHHGGCFCDYCMSGFAQHLKVNSTPELLAAAKATSFDGFDYRSFVKNIAPTRDQYLSLAAGIPLHLAFVDYQLSCAADNVAACAKLASDVAGVPVSLSANVNLPSLEHLVVTPHCTYFASEIAHHAHEGTKGLLHAASAYRMAEAVKRPMAATATAVDWAVINECRAEQLVCTWIALAYACGARFMVPNRVACATGTGGSHWYCGSAATFAPLYQFIKKHGALLNGFEAVGPFGVPEGLPASFETHEKRQAFADALDIGKTAPISVEGDAGVWVFPRVKSDGSFAVHVVSLACDVKAAGLQAAGRRPAQKNVEVRLPNSLFKRNFANAVVHAFDADPVTIPVTNEAQTCSFVLPELKLWSIVTFEYWA
jgi:hypothetical protein